MMKKKTYVILFVATLVIVMASFYSKPWQPITSQSSFVTLKSEKQLNDIVNQLKRKDFFNYFNRSFATTNFAEASDGVSSYTTTNNQIENIDEADVLKTNGETTYFIDNNILYEYSTNPNKSIMLNSKLDFNNEDSIYYNNLLLFKEYLVVLGSSYNFSCYGIDDCMIPFNDDSQPDKSNDLEIVNESFDSMMMLPQVQQILVYKISDDSLELQDKLEIEGTYLGARMIENSLFLITNKNNYFTTRSESTTLSKTLLPKRTMNNKEIEAAVDEIVINQPESLNMLSITKLDVHTSKLDTLSYMNNATQILLYQDILFVASENYDYQNTTTEIASFSTSTLEPLHSQKIEGHLLNSFSMDFYDNHLRVALSTSSENSTSNRLVILNEKLQLKSSINNLAKDERIYSVLFKQDRAYVVTFKEIDPLFVFDLSNPSNPIKLSELKIPGFSNYLHQVDEDTIVGFGKDVKLEQGFIKETSLKISMFDVSDGNNPKETDVYFLGNEFASSEILYNHRALLVDKTRKWFGFVISDYSVFFYDNDSNIASSNYNQQFILMDTSNQKLTNLYQQQSKSDQYFIRSIIVDDTLFLFSNLDVTIINTETFESSILKH